MKNPIKKSNKERRQLIAIYLQRNHSPFQAIECRNENGKEKVEKMLVVNESEGAGGCGGVDGGGREV